MSKSTLSLKDALVAHRKTGQMDKKASYEAKRKRFLLKAASSYVVAIQKGDVAMKKEASAALAQGVTLFTLEKNAEQEKKAGLAQLLNKAVRAGGRGLVGAGRKVQGSLAGGAGALRGRIGRALRGAGSKLQGVGARGVGKTLKGVADRGVKAVRQGVKKSPLSSLIAGAGAGAVGTGLAAGDLKLQNPLKGTGLVGLNRGGAQ